MKITAKKHNIFILAAAFFLLLFRGGFAHGVTVDTVNLLEAAKTDGIELYWNSLTGSGMLEKDGRRITFRADDSLMLLDYSKLALTDAPRIDNGTLVVSRGFIDTMTDFFSTQDNAVSSDFYRIGAIVIDAGHGGKDPGAFATHTINGVKTTIYEKDITLATSKLLYEQLTRAYPDKKILLTRNDDRFLELEQRTEIANSVPLDEREAVLFISVHVNSSLSQSATGFEVWYLSPGYRRTVLSKSDVTEDKALFAIFNDMMEEEYTTESIRIAQAILDGLNKQIGSDSPSRGIKAEEWFVVKNAKMPSVLAEIGFLSNSKEAALLLDQAYLRKVATGIYNGLDTFVRHFESSRGFTGIQ
jgi:N-acetylmuramoyl-L-alanine amidase